MPPKVRVKKDRGYTDEELLKIVNIADERMKVVIYLLRSSGCRIGAIRELRVRNLQRIKQDEDEDEDRRKTNQDLYKVTIYENEPEEYPSFVSPEGTRAIDSYLDMRRRYGEKIVPDSILIREQFDIRDDFSIANPKQISTSTLQNKLTALAERAGIREKTHLKEGQKSGTIRKQVPIAHGFRKSFTTTANNAGMNIIHRRMIEGHDVGIDDHYVLPPESDLLKEYQKSIDALTIDPANRLQRKVEMLEVKKSQFENMQDQINALAEQLKYERKTSTTHSKELKSFYLKDIPQVLRRNMSSDEMSDDIKRSKERRKVIRETARTGEAIEVADPESLD